MTRYECVYVARSIQDDIRPLSKDYEDKMHISFDPDLFSFLQQIYNFIFDVTIVAAIMLVVQFAGLATLEQRFSRFCRVCFFVGALIVVVIWLAAWLQVY